MTFHTSSSGTLYVERFADELGATGDALIKPLTGNFNAAGAQEVLSHDIAHAMHIDHMVPVVGRRPNGDAAVELVYGGSLGLNNIHTSWNLEHALRDSWRLRAPDLPAPDINRLARVERHVAMLYKHAIGDIDFHPGNGVWNRETGRMALIDNARLATGEDVLAPVMDSSYRIGPDTGVAGRITTLQLLPEAVEVARSTDLGVLDDAFRRAAQVRPYYGVDSAYADAVRARIKHAAATGSIRMTRG